MGVLLIEGCAVRLIVGPIRSTNQGTLVNIQAEPFKAFDSIVNSAFNCTCFISIFNAQDECAASMAGIDPRKKSRAVYRRIHKTHLAWTTESAPCVFSSWAIPTPGGVYL